MSRRIYSNQTPPEVADALDTNPTVHVSSHARERLLQRHRLDWSPKEWARRVRKWLPRRVSWELRTTRTGVVRWEARVGLGRGVTGVVALDPSEMGWILRVVTVLSRVGVREW